MRIVAVFGRAAVDRLVDEIVVRPELDTDGNGADAAHHAVPPRTCPVSDPLAGRENSTVRMMHRDRRLRAVELLRLCHWLDQRKTKFSKRPQDGSVGEIRRTASARDKHHRIRARQTHACILSQAQNEIAGRRQARPAHATEPVLPDTEFEGQRDSGQLSTAAASAEPLHCLHRVMTHAKLHACKTRTESSPESKDVSALRALYAFRHGLGVSVPEGDKVIGLDNIKQSGLKRYELATVDLDSDERVRPLVRLIRDRIECSVAPPLFERTEAKLIARRTVA